MTIDIAQHTNSIAHLHRVAVVWLRTNIDTNVFDTTANPPDKILQDKICLMLVLFWRKYANEVLPSARCRRYNLIWKVFPNSKNEKRLLNKFFHLHFFYPVDRMHVIYYKYYNYCDFSQTCRDITHCHWYKMIQMTICLNGQFQCPESNIIQSLIVEQHALISIFHQLMEWQNRIVWPHNGIRHIPVLPHRWCR